MSKNKETKQIEHFTRDEEVHAKFGLLLILSYLMAVASTSKIVINLLTKETIRDEIIIMFVIANIGAALYGFLLKIPVNEFLAKFWLRVLLFVLLIACFSWLKFRASVV